MVIEISMSIILFHSNLRCKYFYMFAKLVKFILGHFFSAPTQKKWKEFCYNLLIIDWATSVVVFKISIIALDVYVAPVIAWNWFSSVNIPSETLSRRPCLPRNCSLNHISDIRPPRPGVSFWSMISIPVIDLISLSYPTVAVIFFYKPEPVEMIT